MLVDTDGYGVVYSSRQRIPGGELVISKTVYDYYPSGKIRGQVHECVVARIDDPKPFLTSMVRDLIWSASELAEEATYNNWSPGTVAN